MTLVAPRHVSGEAADPRKGGSGQAGPEPAGGQIARGKGGRRFASWAPAGAGVTPRIAVRDRVASHGHTTGDGPTRSLTIEAT